MKTMIHGGVAFKDLKVGQAFRFPAHAKPGQYRSHAYVKVSAQKYVPQHNEPSHGHSWNVYEHDVRSGDVHVAPGAMLSARDLAECLRGIDETKKQDRTLSHSALSSGSSGGGALSSGSSGGGARLTYQEKKAAPDSAFALPDKRMFYIGDATHAVDAMSRLSKSWNMGHLTEAEYRRAHAVIRAAEEHFGIHHHAGHKGARKVVQRETRAMAESSGGGAVSSGSVMNKMQVFGKTIVYPRGEAKAVRAIVAAMSGASGRVSASALRDILPGRHVRHDMRLSEALGLVGAHVAHQAVTW